jgi:hypothetical protein
LILARASFIARNAAARNLLLIQTFNRRLRFVVIGHLNKSKSAGTTRLPVNDDADASHFAELTKCLLDFVFRCSKRQIANVDIRH